MQDLQNAPEFAQAYFAAAAAASSDQYIALFSDTVVVRDDGHTHRGLAAVRRWHDAAPTVLYALREVTGTATACQAVAEVSGDFPGSPVDLRFAFERDRTGKITVLDISV
ncbi:nuclear transport factor 2 family protein [Streptomyces sp. SID5785]|uniref:nuclear transport factor 2 family protein n=1 Tax=Streptomyces sp. SID5785 TaxID=2690309 RepID=UPI001361408A|nr:nuclear transport factor 2 family protein [Streptomyces sp. SID5785]MZD05803.1 nuclear transport factor 2 family protein [Streptomyces sp. SID5785]